MTTKRTKPRYRRGQPLEVCVLQWRWSPEWSRTGGDACWLYDIDGYSIRLSRNNRGGWFCAGWRVFGTSVVADGPAETPEEAIWRHVEAQDRHVRDTFRRDMRRIREFESLAGMRE